MKRPNFMEGIGVALAASIGGGLLFGMLTTVFAGGFVLRLLIAGMGLLYVLYLLQRSGEKVGRITAPAVWLLIASALGLLGLSLPFYLMAHLGIVWLIRSLYFYSSLFSALADLGLVLFGVAAAAWALVETGNLFLSFWSFFLVQALFALIPNSWKRSGKPVESAAGAEDRFLLAHRAAEAALTKLSTVR
ncbi:MAG: hypothetical protein P8166_07825 [Candidatus Thiodiazotropha sp.]